MKNTVLLLAVFLCFNALNGFCSGNKDIESLKSDIARIEKSLNLDHEQVTLLRNLLDNYTNDQSSPEFNHVSEGLSDLQQQVESLEKELKMLQGLMMNGQAGKEVSLERSNRIMDSGSLKLEPVALFIHSRNPNEKLDDIKDLLRIYMETADREKVNYEIAIAQMCYTTDYLKRIDNKHNYAGFNPDGTGRATISFKNREEGVLAHIQHLKAYASPESIPRNQLVDPRYVIMEKLGYLNTVETFDQLYAKWAPHNEAEYGRAITEIITELRKVSDIK